MGTYQLVSERSILTMAIPTEILQLMSDDFQRGFKKLLMDNQHMQEGFNNLRKILQEEIQDVKQVSSAQEESTYSGSLSSRRVEKSQRNAADVQPFIQKFGPTTINAINFDHLKQISPIIFYGSHRMPPKRPPICRDYYMRYTSIMLMFLVTKIKKFVCLQSYFLTKFGILVYWYE